MVRYPAAAVGPQSSPAGTTSTHAAAAGEPVGAAGGLAAVLVRTARAALGMTSAEMTEAAGCAESLVEDIEWGRLDPTLDTAGRLVSAVGLEIRARPDHKPNPRYIAVDGQETERLRAAFKEACEFASRFGAGPPRPAPRHPARMGWKRSCARPPVRRRLDSQGRGRVVSAVGA